MHALHSLGNNRPIVTPSTYHHTGFHMTYYTPSILLTLELQQRFAFSQPATAWPPTAALLTLACGRGGDGCQEAARLRVQDAARLEPLPQLHISKCSSLHKEMQVSILAEVALELPCSLTTAKLDMIFDKGRIAAGSTDPHSQDSVSLP